MKDDMKIVMAESSISKQIPLKNVKTVSAHRLCLVITMKSGVSYACEMAGPVEKRKSKGKPDRK